MPHETTPRVLGRDDTLERAQLRTALIGAKNSMESTAAFLAGRGFAREARTLRADVEVAQATLDGPAAVDALWARRNQPTVQAA